MGQNLQIIFFLILNFSKKTFIENSKIVLTLTIQPNEIALDVAWPRQELRMHEILVSNKSSLVLVFIFLEARDSFSR